MIHERPLAAQRLVAAVLAEAHGTEIVAKQLRRDPKSARALVEIMLADRQLGPIVRERCSAHLASKPKENQR